MLVGPSGIDGSYHCHTAQREEGCEGRGGVAGLWVRPPTDPAAPPFSMRSAAAAEEGTARSDPLREVVRVIRASNEGPLSSNDN